MIRRRLEKQIGAYRDGALTERQADVLRRRLESDPEARAELARYESIGQLSREAWREGPPAPSPEMLIAGLRPGMARVDAEIEARGRTRRSWLLPLPVFAIGAAAAVLIAVMLRSGTPPAVPSASPASPATLARAESAVTASVGPVVEVGVSAPRELPVYDLKQGDSPLVVFEDGGTTFIWLLDEPERRKDLSSWPAAGGWV